jgi:hypothetical protein
MSKCAVFAPLLTLFGWVSSKNVLKTSTDAESTDNTTAPSPPLSHANPAIVTRHSLRDLLNQKPGGDLAISGLDRDEKKTSSHSHQHQRKNEHSPTIVFVVTLQRQLQKFFDCTLSNHNRNRVMT